MNSVIISLLMEDDDDRYVIKKNDAKRLRSFLVCLRVLCFATAGCKDLNIYLFTYPTQGVVQCLTPMFVNSLINTLQISVMYNKYNIKITDIKKYITCVKHMLTTWLTHCKHICDTL